MSGASSTRWITQGNGDRSAPRLLDDLVDPGSAQTGSLTNLLQALPGAVQFTDGFITPRTQLVLESSHEFEGGNSLAGTFTGHGSGAHGPQHTQEMLGILKGHASACDLAAASAPESATRARSDYGEAKIVGVCHLIRAV